MNDNKLQTQAKRDDRAMEYVPFGSDSKIRLTIEIVKATICKPTKSGKFPDDRDIIGFMMMCQAQRLNPYAKDAYLVGYDGKNGPEFSQITAHQALLKRAEVSEYFDGMQSGIIVVDSEGKVSEVEGDFYTREQEVIGGWAKVYHAKRKGYPFYKRLRLEAFKKENAFWDRDPAGQICKCAEADALRTAFPTMLGGLYIAEEQNLPIDISSTVTATVGEPKPVKTIQSADGKTVAEIAAPVRTAQQDLEAVVIEGGFTFNQFRQWAIATEVLKGADSLADFGEIKEADANRLLKAKSGMLMALKGANTI